MFFFRRFPFRCFGDVLPVLIEIQPARLFQTFLPASIRLSNFEHIHGALEDQSQVIVCRKASPSKMLLMSGVLLS